MSALSGAGPGAARKRRGRVTLGRVVAIALPVVLSNATVPLQGAIDTAIIGNLGDAVYLAAVTLGAQALTLLLALFNFLQFGAAALGAQALGAGDRRRVVNVLARALILAGGIGLALIAGQAPILAGLMAIFEGSAEAERLAGVYFSIRIWAAPAELGVFAQPRKLLAVVEGLEMRKLEGNEECCGFGGTFCVKYPAISNAIVEEKAAAIERTGAELLLAGDLGCLMNMAGKLSRRGAKVRAFHTIEVLAGTAETAPAIGEEG